MCVPLLFLNSAMESDHYKHLEEILLANGTTDDGTANTEALERMARELAQLQDERQIEMKLQEMFAASPDIAAIRKYLMSELKRRTSVILIPYND